MLIHPKIHLFSPRPKNRIRFKAVCVRFYALRSKMEESLVRVEIATLRGVKLQRVKKADFLRNR